MAAAGAGGSTNIRKLLSLYRIPIQIKSNDIISDSVRKEEQDKDNAKIETEINFLYPKAVKYVTIYFGENGVQHENIHNAAITLRNYFNLFTTTTAYSITKQKNQAELIEAIRYLSNFKNTHTAIYEAFKMEYIKFMTSLKKFNVGEVERIGYAELKLGLPSSLMITETLKHIYINDFEKRDYISTSTEPHSYVQPYEKISYNNIAGKFAVCFVIIHMFHYAYLGDPHFTISFYNSPEKIMKFNLNYFNATITNMYNPIIDHYIKNVWFPRTDPYINRMQQQRELSIQKNSNSAELQAILAEKEALIERLSILEAREAELRSRIDTAQAGIEAAAGTGAAAAAAAGTATPIKSVRSSSGSRAPAAAPAAAAPPTARSRGRSRAPAAVAATPAAVAAAPVVEDAPIEPAPLEAAAPIVNPVQQKSWGETIRNWGNYAKGCVGSLCTTRKALKQKATADQLTPNQGAPQSRGRSRAPRGQSGAPRGRSRVPRGPPPTSQGGYKKTQRRRKRSN